jgi:hypothetical protein
VIRNVIGGEPREQWFAGVGTTITGNVYSTPDIANGGISASVDGMPSDQATPRFTEAQMEAVQSRVIEGKEKGEWMEGIAEAPSDYQAMLDDAALRAPQQPEREGPER